MTDIRSISTKDLAKRIDGLPSAAKAFLSSPPFIGKIKELEKDNVLLEELDQPYLLEQIILFTVTGFITERELPDQMKELLFLDEDAAGKISREVVEMLKPVLNKTQQILEKPGFAAAFTGEKGVASQSQIPQSQAEIPSSVKTTAGKEKKTEIARNATIMPGKEIASAPRLAMTRERVASKVSPVNLAGAKPIAPNIPATGSSSEPAPFIMHAREEQKTQQPRPIQEYGTGRPTFIKPQFGARIGGGAPPQPAAAQVQFGDQIVTPKKELNMFKVVNYSAPKLDTTAPAVPDVTPAPPIMPTPPTHPTQIKQSDKNEKFKTEAVNPDVINLRDLPK